MIAAARWPRPSGPTATCTSRSSARTPSSASSTRPAAHREPRSSGRPADGVGPAAIAAGRDKDGNLVVYVAETTGLRVLTPDPNTQPATVASFGVDGASIASLAYDDKARVLWAGTADAATSGAGSDRLLRIATDDAAR